MEVLSWEKACGGRTVGCREAQGEVRDVLALISVDVVFDL
jgi:hypothetical protein